IRIFFTPLSIARGVRRGSDTVSFQPLLKLNPDLRIFLVVIDHRAAVLQRCHDRVIVFFQARVKTGGIDSATHAQREMAGWLAAGIEVLVIPTTRRTIDAAFLPVHFDDLVLVAALVRLGPKLLRPEQYVTRRSKPQQSGAGAMIMGLVITTHRPLGNVA